METLYVIESGLTLGVRSNRIVAKRNGKVVDEIHMMDLKRIVVLGDARLSSQTMPRLVRKGIDLSFLSPTGEYRVRSCRDPGKNLFLRKAQRLRCKDPDFGLRSSRVVVESKLESRRQFLSTHCTSGIGAGPEDEVRSLDMLQPEVRVAKTVADIRALDAKGSESFFAGFAKLLPADYGFRRRREVPPPDPVGCLLTLGRALLRNEIAFLLCASNFDPYCGFLHANDFKEPSLAADLLEEWKTPAADRLALLLAQKSVIPPDRFRRTDHGVRPDEIAIKTFLANYEGYMTTPFETEEDPGKSDFRKRIARSVESFKRAVKEGTDYRPFRTGRGFWPPNPKPETDARAGDGRG